MQDHAVTVFASFRPIPGKEPELQELLAWMVGNTRAEPGCERYDLYRGEGEPATFHLFESYRDGRALERHRDAAYFVEYRRRVVDLLEAPIDVVVMTGVDVSR